MVCSWFGEPLTLHHRTPEVLLVIDAPLAIVRYLHIVDLRVETQHVARQALVATTPLKEVGQYPLDWEVPLRVGMEHQYLQMTLEQHLVVAQLGVERESQKAQL